MSELVGIGIMTQQEKATETQNNPFGTDGSEYLDWLWLAEDMLMMMLMLAQILSNSLGSSNGDPATHMRNSGSASSQPEALSLARQVAHPAPVWNPRKLQLMQWMYLDELGRTLETKQPMHNPMVRPCQQASLHQQPYPARP